MSNDIDEKIKRLQETWKELQKRTAPIPPPGQVDYGHSNYAPHKEKKDHEKKAFALPGVVKNLAGDVAHLPQNLKDIASHEDGARALQEVGGLGILAIPSVDQAQAWARARLSGDKTEEGVHQREILPGIAHPLAEIGGLAVLARPEFKHLHAPPKLAAILDELEKIGFVTDDEAARALQSLNDLEDSRPTRRQTRDYMALGAIAAPTIYMAGNAIKGKPLLDGGTAALKARDALAQAFKGGIGGTAVSFGQQHIDRKHNMDKLREYVQQADVQQHNEPGEAFKTASVGLEELQRLLNDAEFLKTASIADLEELEKIAFGLSNIRSGIANVAGKISPTLNKPVMQAAQQGAHALQHSNNSFVQGMGNVLHHKAQSPRNLALGALNPVGTAAETIAGGVGNAASKGMVGAGQQLQQRFGTNDSVVQQGRAMTPMGRMQNALGNVGQRMQSSFSQGGMGHKVLNNVIPRAAEIGGAAALGTALHVPTGLSGVLGHAASAGLAKAAPVAQAALNHAPAAIQGAASAIGGAAKSLGGGFLQHAAEDALGTGKQEMFSGALGRLTGGAAKAVGHTMAPGAMNSFAPAMGALGGAAMGMIPKAPALPRF